MARIETYGLDSVINDADKVIGSDGVAGPNYGITKNYTVGELKDHINAGVIAGSSFAGWARYDGSNSHYDDTPITVTDGNYTDPPVTLTTNQLIDPFEAISVPKFVFTQADINSTYMLTTVLQVEPANANQTHVDVNFISGSTDYERLSKSVAFYKGNDTIQNFHEVFQFYVDSDLVTYGLQPRIYARGGTIKVGNVIYFIQKTQTA